MQGTKGTSIARPPALRAAWRKLLARGGGCGRVGPPWGECAGSQVLRVC